MNQSISIRAFADGDEERWLLLLKEAYGTLDDRSLHDISQLVKSEDLRAGLFLAESEQGLVGCIRVKPLRKGRYELWDLAVSKSHRQSGLPALLVENGLSYLRKANAQLARAHTLAIEPYVSAYSGQGFTPARRILRIDWNLDDRLPQLSIRQDISIRDALLSDSQRIAGAYVRALTPYWDWWAEDQGGTEELAKLTEDAFRKRDGNVRWLLAESNQDLVGLTGLRVQGSAGRLFGVMVPPEHRMHQIGSTLMEAALARARNIGLRTIRVYTVAFLDRLAPGAILYLKSGGKVTAEYLQLEVDLKTRK